MRKMTILSGKGGTGKTTVTGSFAALSSNAVFADCDVDASNLHLLLKPKIRETIEFKGLKLAVIDHEKCTKCGLCEEKCRFNAIHDFNVDPVQCEGCGVCVYFCPEEAIDFPLKTCGEWYVSETRFGPMVHAMLGIAEENSGKLVTLVRQEAKKLADARDLDLILTDGPPGVGCPVIASIGGAAAVLIVTEPTVSGEHDLERVAQLAHHFNVPAMVCVNKFDLNPDRTKDIEKYAKRKDLVFLGQVPFDPIFTRAMVKAQTVFEYDGNSEAGKVIKKIWGKICKGLGTNY